MSAVTTESVAPPQGRPRLGANRRLWRTLYLLSAIMLLLSFVRVVSDAQDITSAGTFAAALGLAVPIAMAGLGGLWSERSGVVNIGLEGMMILGTWGMGWAAYQWGPWVGLLAAIAFGALGGLLHALATVTFGVDQIVSGVAINILALGLTQYLSAVAFEGVEGGGPTQSPRFDAISTVSVPGVDSLLSPIADKDWFFVSDVANLIIGLTTGVSLITVLAILLLVASFVVLWRTAFGLRLRSCGENPWAAESLGVRVYRYKYVAVVMSGVFAGIGGAYLADAANIYREGQTGGRGYIGLAAMIFGNWRPAGLASGAGLFGYIDALQLRQGGTSVHALLLAAAILLGLFAAIQLWRQRWVSGAVVGVIGAVVLWWYLVTDEVAGEIASIAPYVTTLLVLALASQRLRMPAADGQIYRRGESH
ncbi:MAG: ABC transporter permease [Actinomycetia bacterium]|jgi:simple sugar transport system permease protein|nr:ABC transporter permease [Actinomycetes bacterium]